MSGPTDGTLRRYEGFDADFGADPVLAAERHLAEGWRWGDYPPVRLEEDAPWGEPDQEFRSLSFRLHCLKQINALLAAFSLSGEVRFLLPAVRVALDWIRANSDRQRPDLPHFAWYGMTVGRRVYRLAYLLDAGTHCGLLAEGERKLLWESLLEHVHYLADDANIMFHSNHGFFQIAGQLATSRRFAGDDPAIAQSEALGRERLAVMLKTQFAPDGSHREHSPNYHRAVYGILKEMIDADLVRDESILAAAESIERALSWFVMPSRRVLNFGDSDLRSLRTPVSAAATAWRTPEMRHVATAGAVGYAPEKGFAAFKAGGYFVLRKPSDQAPEDYARNSYLAQTAAFHSRTHKQADDLSFVWSEGGEDLLVDAGRYGYLGLTERDSPDWLAGNWYSNPFRMYCESTRAHNTLEFDGQDYPRKGVKPYGSALTAWTETGDGLVAVETQCRHFGSIRRGRVLVLQPGQWLLVFDWFHDNAGAAHHVRQWFHLAQHLRLEATDLGYLVRDTAVGLPLQAASLLAAPAGSRLFLGEREPVIQGWWSPKERDIVPGYAFCYELGGVPTGAFATLFSFTRSLTPDRAWSKVNASGRKTQFLWRDDSGLHELRLDRSGGAGPELVHALRP